MPYAIFCDGARLSKTYPTEADVWERARQSGLLVEVAAADDALMPRPAFDHDYEIRRCPPDPHQHLADDQAEADWAAEMGFLASWTDADGDGVIAANAGALSRRSATVRKRPVATRLLALARAAWDSSKPHVARPD